MPAGDSSKVPILRVHFQGYDDFLVEYGDHLRDGRLVLPGESGFGADQKVRIKLMLPDASVLYLTGVTKRRGETFGGAGSPDDVIVQLATFTDKQRGQLERCLKGAISSSVDGAAPEIEAPPINLLLVDDSVTVRIELGDALRDRGLRVRVAENGLVAIAAALKRPPEIILSDVEMPVMDGWTFLRMVRGRKRLAHIPVVFFTRLNDDLSRLQGYKMGVEDYLPKDLSPDEIVARLTSALARGKRGGSPSKEGASTGQGLHGDLRHVRLGSLLSFIESEKRTGVLKLEHRGDRATIRVRAGALVGVDNLGNFSHPHDRIFELLDWPTGTFEFVTDVVEAGEGSPTRVTYLLMEHARRTDEAAAGG
jgi:CheY-like chemotaxis protein